MSKQEVYNEEVKPEEGFAEGDVEPNCEGQSCANMADDDTPAVDEMADQTDAEPVDEAAEALAKAEAEAAEWRDKYLRLQAEFDNYRKRTLKEKMSLVESGGENVIKALLPVVDDVDRALAAMEKSDDVEALRGGVRLISQKFNEVMRQQGVSEIEAVGKEFDVDVHEAVARFPIDGKNSGEIIDVVQKGYKLGDKVIRYAKVVVAE
ncbi:MAG: nucleotide exchange factor GrpE [Rikenellaceae bacterium]|nr:nucleotide exchange factor GrpE [Rikenellaceae bacterium]MBP3682258.1 nucleotide exchange factor GrpE [Rikenellaceae bacterium]MBQ8746122.1 nucleotide exchange factor GrpE [Rikenellaceae bacterium]MBQ9147257.1 nucleotide exchange factor GrpE [Rikenellaceae bacterium]MBR2502344.1 nucleotide exchange factor GrpE [Rikenellaceae bacterium]